MSRSKKPQPTPDAKASSGAAEDALSPNGKPHLCPDQKSSEENDELAIPSSPSSSSLAIPPSLSPPSESQDTMFRGKRAVPLFVASLGNPKPYTLTLHSAGHLVLSLLVRDNEIGYDNFRPFQAGEIADGNVRSRFSLVQGYAKQYPLPTLWKSGSMMNVSGPAVKKAWNAWKKNHQSTSEGDVKPKLVIVHDELEKELGTVSVRVDHKLSAKGHNGIKSLQQSFQQEGFIRIGVGIGRPTSRDPAAVSNYVLRKITERELQALQLASKKVWQQIQEIHEGAIG